MVLVTRLLPRALTLSNHEMVRVQYLGTVSSSEGSHFISFISRAVMYKQDMLVILYVKYTILGDQLL